MTGYQSSILDLCIYVKEKKKKHLRSIIAVKNDLDCLIDGFYRD